MGIKEKIIKTITFMKGKTVILLYNRHFLGNKSLFIEGKTKFLMKSGSTITIKGKLITGHNAFGDTSTACLIRLEQNARFLVNGRAELFYGSDIVLFPDSYLQIGNSFINSNCKIRVTKKIIIGDGCAISHDFTVMDSNQHRINGLIKTEEVIIEDHVWIGTRVTVLPGVRIAEGTVVAAGSVVTKSFPSHSLIAGVPAKLIKENVMWSEK